MKIMLDNKNLPKNPISLCRLKAQKINTLYFSFESILHPRMPWLILWKFLPNNIKFLRTEISQWFLIPHLLCCFCQEEFWLLRNSLNNPSLRCEFYRCLHRSDRNRAGTFLLAYHLGKYLHLLELYIHEELIFRNFSKFKLNWFVLFIVTLVVYSLYPSFDDLTV